MEYRLCPSILSADFNRLGEQIKILEKEGVEYLLLRKPLRTMRSADSDMKIIWSCTRN